MGLISHTTANKTGPNKLVLGFAALAATAVVGTTGIAAAQSQGKPSKEACEQAGFTNYGQCVREWAHNKNMPGHGYGYGGSGGGDGSGAVGNTANVDLALDVSGDNNVITIILNLFH